MQFVKDLNLAFWVGNCSRLSAYLSSSFTWRDGYGGAVLNASQYLAQCHASITSAAETILVDSAYLDNSDPHAPRVVIIGPSAAVVRDPKTQKPCMVMFGQTCVVTLSSGGPAPYKVESLHFAYETNIENVAYRKCHTKF